MFDKILLFLWYPLSTGMIDGINTNVHGNVSYQHIIMLIFPIYGIFRALQNPAKYLIKNRYFYSIYFFMISHSLIMSVSADTLFRLTLYLGVAQWAYYLIKKMEFNDFIMIIALSASFFLVVSILFSLILPSLSFEEIQGRNGMSSFYGHKNTYGRFLQVSMLMYFITFLLSGKKKWLFVLALSAIILFAFSGSRTSMFVAILGIVIGILSRYQAMTSLRALSLVFATIILTWVGVQMDQVYTYRLGSIYDGISFFGFNIDLTGRLTIWDAIINYQRIEGSLLFGNGYGDFFSSKAYSAMLGIGIGDFMPRDSHNGYIDTFVNFGIFGTALFLSLAIMCFIKYKKTHKVNPVAACFAITFLVCYLFVNLTEAYIIKTTNIYSFIFWCLLFSSWNKNPLLPVSQRKV